ncbi:MAG: non-homologous end-joining DNA ligase [Ornithinimicrobium sp.]
MTAADPTRLVIAGRDVRVSSLDKVMYPATGTTKLQVLQHYIQVSEHILPRLAGRPLTRVRWPDGVEGAHFFEKNLPSGAPDWLPSVTLQGHGWGSRSVRGSVTYPMVEDLSHLIYLVNLGSLELHVPQWRVDEQGLPRPPDRLVIDLDPGPGAGLAQCAQVAMLVRERVEGTGLTLTAVTSGSKGMQLYAELEAQRDAAEVSAVAKGLAQQLAAAHPHLVVWRMTKSLRAGKVFLDWSQNAAAKTTICPWSLRGRERPTVATPRRWREIEQAAHGHEILAQVAIDNVADYLSME